MLLRIVKYFVLIVSEPIVRVTLNVLCRLQGFRTTRVNNWVFRGPPDFIRLVNEAEKRLRSEDSDLLKATAGHCTVMYSPRRTFTFLPWKYAGISRDFLAWGCEGIVAAWVYFTYKWKSAQKGRWFFTDVRVSLHESREVRARTKEWLTQHGFPVELREAFNADSGSGRRT